MSPAEAAAALLSGRRHAPARDEGHGFAPANIALAKYWGKRDEALNLPQTSSLSVSLGNLGTRARVACATGPDVVRLNGDSVAPEHGFARRVSRFLDLVRPPGVGYRVDTHNDLPTGAGLASSASGFAALTRALDQLHGWNLPVRALSILARLGSGSAARSIEPGFVLWQAGTLDDGSDSYAEALPARWPELRVGLVTVSREAKAIGSREAMQRTRATSALYTAWPARATEDLARIRTAIDACDFAAAGEAAEANALTMHATSLGARPPILFWLPGTVAAMQAVWRLRREGVGAYFTIDAGPNVKLLFLAADGDAVAAAFPGVRVVAPFA